MVEGGGREVHLRFIVKVGTIGFTDGSDVGDEGNGEVSGLGNCMKWNTIY